MVTKSKLKMALAAEKGVDFKKQHLKKVQKAAKKEKSKKAGAGKGKKVEEDWEDVEIEEEAEDVGGKSDEEEAGSNSEEEADGLMQVCFVVYLRLRL